MVFHDTGVKPRDFFPLDSFVTNKVDTIGAGDAYLAATSYFYAITKKYSPLYKENIMIIIYF